MDRIVVPGIPARAHVGVTEAERASEQDIEVAVTLHLDLRAAGESDQLGHTVDYESVCDVVDEVATSGPFHLVEAVAERIASSLLDRLEVPEVTVEVRKPAALAARGVPYTAVEIRRSRA